MKYVSDKDFLSVLRLLRKLSEMGRGGGVKEMEAARLASLLVKKWERKFRTH